MIQKAYKLYFKELTEIRRGILGASTSLIMSDLYAQL